jgi:hypothetical protein
MSQILHIFRKDVRHHWPEICISLAAITAFAWQEPQRWDFRSYYASPWLPTWPQIIVVLWLSWMLLILRVVQGEPLAGDRQFWVTRPYEWPKLLAAKILFILTFASLPLLVAESLLLWGAGFSPSPHFPALLLLQLIIVALFVLPTAAAATVTSSLAQFLFLLLGAALYLFGFGSLVDKIPDSSVPGTGPIPVALLLVPFIGTCLLVVLWQYARRKTMQSRIALGCMLAIVPAVLATTPYRTFISRAYPIQKNGQQPLVNFAFLPVAPDPKASGDLAETDMRVWIDLPVSFSGIEPGSIVDLKGTSVAIESPESFRWMSPWRPENSRLWPGPGTKTIAFQLTKELFDSVKGTPVNLRISFALVGYQETNKRTFIVSKGKFAVQHLGICESLPKNSSFLACRSPLIIPPFVATLDEAAMTCPPPTTQGSEVPEATSTGGEWDDTPVTAFDPVSSFSISFERFERNDRANVTPTTLSLCPGTAITLYTPQIYEKSRAELELDGIRLGDYEQSRVLALERLTQ